MMTICSYAETVQDANWMKEDATSGGLFTEATKAPEAPKPVETYETQQEAVRSKSEANRRRSSFSNTFVAVSYTHLHVERD